MNRFMMWIRNFMQGRHGNDGLNIALMVVYLVLAITAQIARLPVLSYIAAIFVVLAFFRMLSRDNTRRYRENAWFMGIFNKVKKTFQNTSDRYKDKTHCYFRCPKCKRQMRVPKGRGKISITCPSCRHEFIKTT